MSKSETLSLFKSLNRASPLFIFEKSSQWKFSPSTRKTGKEERILKKSAVKTISPIISTTSFLFIHHLKKFLIDSHTLAGFASISKPDESCSTMINTFSPGKVALNRLFASFSKASSLFKSSIFFSSRVFWSSSSSSFRSLNPKKAPITIKKEKKKKKKKRKKKKKKTARERIILRKRL